MKNCVEMVFWDVQHGHATYLKTPNDKHIVVDLGIGSYDDNNEDFSPLLHLKDNWGVEALNLVVITHPHLDHIDDIMNFDALKPIVLKRASQLTNDEVMEGKENAKKKDVEKFEKYCQINSKYKYPVPSDSVDNPTNPDNFGGLQVLFFTPTSCNHNNFNNHSIVTIFIYEKIKIVIPGDNEKCSFEELLADEKFKEAIKDSDVLLAPHHGRESGYNKEFVELVNPRITIVSDGRFCDTSANARYSEKSRGWDVFNGKKNEYQNRKCLTTNSDGEIFIRFGLNNKGERFLFVKIK